jgi:hypothetical protein
MEEYMADFLDYKKELLVSGKFFLNLKNQG